MLSFLYYAEIGYVTWIASPARIGPHVRPRSFENFALPR